MYNILDLLIIYLVIINIAGFAAMGIDKYKAIHHRWRIPEKTLFLIAIIGGGIGSYVGMIIFRHKTKHIVFIYGMPSIIIIHIGIAGYIAKLSKFF